MGCRMPMMSQNRPCALVAAALVFVALATATAHAADNAIATRFEMYGFAGAHVLSLHSRTDEDGSRYSVAIDFKTEGMAALFVDMTSHSQVSGRIVGGVAEPYAFRDQSRRNGTERHASMDYRPDGSVEAVTTPPLPDSVPPTALRGSVDNLSAYMRLQRQLAQTGHCGLTVRVFDGRHGYDLVFTDAGRQALTPSSGQNFSGDTIACHMARRNWEGFTDNEKDEGAHTGTLWYARLVPGALMVPVRMRMDTQLGVVEGLLAELHGRGVNLALMQ